MPPERSFIERLQSHQGGLVRVNVNGKIGLLLDAEPVRRWGDVVKVRLFIDRKFHTHFVNPEEIELLGADDAS